MVKNDYVKEYKKGGPSDNILVFLKEFGPF
jgi:hypothetical protein